MRGQGTEGFIYLIRMFFFSSVIHVVFFQDGTLDTCLEPFFDFLKASGEG